MEKAQALKAFKSSEREKAEKEAKEKKAEEKKRKSEAAEKDGEEGDDKLNKGLSKLLFKGGRHSTDMSLDSATEEVDFFYG